MVNSLIYLITQKRELGRHLSEYLREKGYEIVITNDGIQGGHETIQTSPALVLIDLYLKNPSGLEVLRLIRNGGFKGEIILLAGVSVSRILPEAFYFGIHQVIGGHDLVDIGQLESAIRALLETEQRKPILYPYKAAIPSKIGKSHWP